MPGRPTRQVSLLTLVMSLSSRLDVQNLLIAHGKTNVPAERRAILNATTVMLVAHWESFVECLFEECVKIRYFNLKEDEQAKIAKCTAGRLSTPNSHNINVLFLSVGVANLMGGVGWSNMSSARATKKLDQLLEARHFIAHGQRTWRTNKYPTKRQVEQWICFVETLSNAVSKHATECCGNKALEHGF